MSEHVWKAGHQQHNKERLDRIATAAKCLKLIQPLVQLDDVVDVGCGIGAWLHAARLLGAKNVQGVEGNWILEADTLVSKNHIRLVDLSHEQPRFAKEFDLAMTIEVAEHLPESAADGFCDSLVSASNCILFSAAIPGQGGIGHINEQPLQYWINKFWIRNYVPLEPIRPYIFNDKSIFWWIRQNIIMFVSYDTFIRSERMMRFARPLSDFGLTYRVRPD